MSQLPNAQRRLLLKMLSAGTAASLMPLQAVNAAQKALAKALHWQNWSGNQQASPQRIVYPGDEAALQRIVTQDSSAIRCMGGSHSFSPLVPCDGTIISIAQMVGLTHHDSAAMKATFKAGTTLGMASQMAYKVGQSFVNESDINTQSLAGAISTSTHGTGTDLPSLSACVDSLRLVTPSGELMVIDRNNPFFYAVRSGLGAFGIITGITFNNQPAYRLKEETQVASIQEAVDYTEKYRHKHRNIEFFAFPFGDTAILKTLDITDQPDTQTATENDNEMLKLACEVSMHAGWLIPVIQKALGLFVSEQSRVGPSYAIYPSSRNVRFNEMEYAVPADQGLDIFKETAEAMRNSDQNVFFPIEYRYCAADDNWLSQFYQRDSATISVHQYVKQDYQPLFADIEPIFKRHGGRPHWGKLNTFTSADARQQFEHFDDFIKLQQQIDPQGRMLNGYMRQLLGASS